MFYSITGKAVALESGTVAISCGPVAFRCYCSANTLRDVHIGDEVTLYTYLVVKEDALELIGFLTEGELEWFKLLITVSGVGPKAALAILSELRYEKLIVAISQGNEKAISASQGIGPKTAKRIILELKDKVTKMGAIPESEGGAFDPETALSSEYADAVAALNMLGYSESESKSALRDVPPDMDAQQMIKYALKRLSRQVW